jgi:acetolactate synthase-1/2/3 large subunit
LRLEPSVSDFTVSDLVAEFLDRCGVDTAFGVVSVHNVPMLDAVSRRNAIRFVMARGELGASHMADGYARSSGKLGVLFSSTGPGVSNAATGMVEARFAGTPLLHLTGQTKTQFVDRGAGTVHDIPDQLGLMQAACKAAYRIHAPQDAFAVLRQAVAEALSFPAGPVTVEIPIDVQSMAVARPAALETYELPVPARVVPSAAEMDALADLVAKAKRPMLWLGRGSGGAVAETLALLDLGFGMVTSLGAHGVISDDHPMNLGTLNGAGLPMVESLYESVDLMVVVGSRVRGYETGDFTAKLPARIVQIDCDPRADGRTYQNIGFVHGDAALVLAELAERIGGTIAIDPDFGEEFGRVKAVARASFKASLGPYATFAEQTRAAMPKDAIWARDITINATTWGHRLLQLHDLSTNVFPISGGIGQGLVLGIGAALGGGGRKAMVLVGDGGLALNLGELWTAVQERLDLVLIVGNDNGYGVIRQIQDKVAGGRQVYDDLLSPDLGELARIAGIPFWRVSDANDFGTAVTEAVAVRGPTMVEIDMRSVGPALPYYPIGPAVQTVSLPE